MAHLKGTLPVRKAKGCSEAAIQGAHWWEQDCRGRADCNRAVPQVPQGTLLPPGAGLSKAAC